MNTIPGNLIEKRVSEDEIQDPFPANDILHVAYEIAKGLEYLHHTAHILHGDMKSYNVLLSNDMKRVKICDFGVCVPLDDDLCLDTSNGDFSYVGTECWTAPEVLFGMLNFVLFYRFIAIITS